MGDLESEYMPMESDPAGRARNMPLAIKNHLFPLYEAVVNSIQAINQKSGGQIKIKIEHDRQQRTLNGGRDVKRVVGFIIEDNGEGFNDKNFKSFNTSDSRLKMDQGCRGVGRFNWPQAFDDVSVESVFEDEQGMMKRTFKFSEGGVSEMKLVSTIGERKTIIRLNKFKKDYAEECPIGINIIAKRVLNHCMSYFIGGNAPSIVLIDEEERLPLQDLFKEYGNLISSSPVEIKGEKFTVHHVKVYGSVETEHSLVYCADGREVKRVQIMKNFSLLDGGKKYHIVNYVFSDLLNRKVLPGRNSFDIPDQKLDDELSLQEIKFELTKAIKRQFEKELTTIMSDKKKKVNQFLSENPEYATVQEDKVIDRINVDMSDEQVEDIFIEVEKEDIREVKNDVKNLMNRGGKKLLMSDADQERILKRYAEIQKNALVKYIIRRKNVLEAYEKCLAKNKGGEYEDEDVFHNILFPKKNTSDDLDVIDECNLWVLDDRLNYFEFATSDKQIRGISDSESQESPDVLIFAEKIENDFVKEVAIVELKKLENYDRDVDKQVFKYIDLLKDAKAFDYNNHKIVLGDNAWFYCYIICDTTNKLLQKILTELEYYPLYGGRGFYKLHREVRAHVEFIDHRKLIFDAKDRNKVFFEKLGVPSADVDNSDLETEDNETL